MTWVELNQDVYASFEEFTQDDQEPMETVEKETGLSGAEVLSEAVGRFSKYADDDPQGDEIIREAFSAVLGSAPGNDFALRIIEACVKMASGRR